ncbi:hypothetical protein [Amycolatopsis sp. H20-H5]|uniref:hypothetical protein n=1 Tax=Amycolatopsis sp. H20-H5 TaxID=3046309 RepID=UPI002DBDDC5E|nr:hypothetical protein [Amycolatopsis sp. H20-H5]MEC3974864.1 hypothetical protein [Amycolatopsis sp. H20-H5]
MNETSTVVDALITGFRDAAQECGRLSDRLDEVSEDLEPVSETVSAMAGSHAVDASHMEIRLDALADRLHAKQSRPW